MVSGLHRTKLVMFQQPCYNLKMKILQNCGLWKQLKHQYFKYFKINMVGMTELAVREMPYCEGKPKAK